MVANGHDKLPALEMPPVERLIELLLEAYRAPRNPVTVSLITESFSAILLSSALSQQFWTAFQNHPDTRMALENVLLNESLASVRSDVATAITDRIASSDS